MVLHRIKKFDVKKNFPHIISIVGVILIIWSLIEYTTSNEYLIETATNNLWGIFILFFISSIFLFPTPLDLMFWGLAAKTDNVVELSIATYLGLLAGQHVNYFLGRFFGNKLIKYINAKSKKWIEDKLYKYESYAVFVFNLLPLPYTIVNFLAGLTSLSYVRWLILVSSSFLIKVIVIAILAK